VIAPALCVVVVLGLKWFKCEWCSMRKNCGCYRVVVKERIGYGGRGWWSAQSIEHYFRECRHLSRVDAKRGDYLPQADLNEAARAADASREANGTVCG
jgi:hypothetical protein